MPSLLNRLKGGDRRSTGAADAVAAAACKNRRVFDTLVGGLYDADPLIRMRSADALEKSSAIRPEWLAAHKRALLAAMHCPQTEVRWHVAQMAPRLRWPPQQHAHVIAWLTECLDDESMIVRTSALTALAKIALSNRALKGKVRKLLISAQASTAPSMRARARRLLRQFPALIAPPN